MFANYGKCIRPSDKTLIRHFVLAFLIPIFLLVLLAFNLSNLLHIDWTVSFSDIVKQFKITPIFVVSIVIGILICVGLIWWYRYYCCDHYRQLRHRQSLARMILDNHWYDTVKVEDSGFFTDVKSKQKERISYWPKLFYKIDNGIIYIKVETSMGKYQEQFLNLEKRLEVGLHCDLKAKEQHEDFIEYQFLYDVIGNRIEIKDVKAKNGKLQLMKNVWWEYDTLPHMLIVGGTGGGKTYFILTLIKALLETNADITVLDPKNTALSDLDRIMPQVYSSTDNIIEAVEKFYQDMLNRKAVFKTLPTYKVGENYAYAKLEPHFLIFDEYIAFMSSLDRKTSEQVMAIIQQITLVGREIGFFLIASCQRPDAKYLADGIRDQFNFRVALGRMSDLGYSMAFGETKKQFFLKPIKGRGYVDSGLGVISEFYTPLVPKGYDFLYEIGRLSANKGRPEQSACGA